MEAGMLHKHTLPFGGELATSWGPAVGEGCTEECVTPLVCVHPLIQGGPRVPLCLVLAENPPFCSFWEKQLS